MAVQRENVRKYLLNTVRLLIEKPGDVESYVDTAMDLAGEMVWAEEFECTTRTKSVTLSSATHKLVDLVSDPQASAVMNIKRETTSDKGLDITILTEEDFDRRFPYPSSLSANKPQYAKVYKNADDVWIAFYPVPASSYTAIVRYKMRWDINNLAIFQAAMAPLYTIACLYHCYPQPTMKDAMWRAYKDFLPKALQNERSAHVTNPVVMVPGSGIPITELPYYGTQMYEGDDWDD